MEAMVPVRKEVSVPGIECRLLPEIRVLSLVHYGPYETIGETYRVLFDALRERSLEADSPCREIYRKGRG
jgi:effector-binding domain-containing protein